MGNGQKSQSMEPGQDGTSGISWPGWRIMNISSNEGAPVFPFSTGIKHWVVSGILPSLHKSFYHCSHRQHLPRLYSVCWRTLHTWGSTAKQERCACSSSGTACVGSHQPFIPFKLPELNLSSQLCWRNIFSLGCCSTSRKGGRAELLCCEEMLHPGSMEKCHTWSLEREVQTPEFSDNS